MKRAMNPKVVAAVTTTICVASILWLMNVKRINDSLDAGLRTEKLKAEAILSEKLLAERDLKKASAELAAMKREYGELDARTKAAEGRLREREAEYQRLAKRASALLAISKERDEIAARHRTLENELAAVRAENNDLRAENNGMTGTIASLEEKNRLLRDDLRSALQATIDQTHVVAVRKKGERQTIRAGRTRKLVASFEVPATLKNLSFRLLDSNGNVINAQDGTIATRITSLANAIASTAGDTNSASMNEVELTFMPNQKLKPGLYKLEVLNEGLYVGTLKVTLK